MGEADDLAAFYAEIAAVESAPKPAAASEEPKPAALPPPTAPPALAPPPLAPPPLAPPPMRPPPPRPVAQASIIPPWQQQQQQRPSPGVPPLQHPSPVAQLLQHPSPGLPPPQHPSPAAPPTLAPPTLRPPPAAHAISAPPMRPPPQLAAPPQVVAPPQLAQRPIPPPHFAEHGGGAGPSHTAGAGAAGASATAQRPAYPKTAVPGEPGKRVGIVRQAAGERWVDPTLSEWPENDYRIFVGNLGTEVSDAVLQQAFQKYASFHKAKIIRYKHNNKSRGYGFVSLMDPLEGARCLKEMEGRYVGNRPVQLKKVDKQERTVVDARTGKPRMRAVQLKEGKGRGAKRPAQDQMVPPPRGGFLHR